MTEQPEQEPLPKHQGRKQQWESVGPHIQRFPVPGGWVYKSQVSDGRARVPALCFVPDEEAAKQDRPPPGKMREARLSGI